MLLMYSNVLDTPTTYTDNSTSKHSEYNHTTDKTISLYYHCVYRDVSECDLFEKI